MIWHDVKLQKEITKQDELGNNVATGDFDIVTETRALYTPWTSEEIVFDSRGVTKTQQKYVVPLPYNTVKLATHIAIDDVNFVIKSVTDLAPRWVSVVCEVFRK